jgi:polar amino acid transport system substrate-binding protein
MAAGGGAPPAEAMRGAKGVSAVIVVVVAVVTFLAGLGIGALVLAPAPTTGPPRLLLGTNTPFPPFEYYNNSTGKRLLVGFDIELIQTLVTRIGYTYEWRDYTDFTALLLAVGSNGVDIAIGAITESGPTGAQRNASMHFTNPYYVSNQGVLKRASDTKNYCAATTVCTASDLNKTGLRIAAQLLTTSEFWVEGNAPAATLALYGSVTQVLQALSSGSADIVVIDKPAADGIAKANPAFKVQGVILTNELYGFAVPRGPPDDPLGLIPRLNAALATARSDGTYDALIKKYFG